MNLPKITSPSIPVAKRNQLFGIALLLTSLLSVIRVNAQTGLWTWISGDNVANITGIYGTKGTGAATNKPGNRDSHSGWKDAAGNFWVFGGWDFNGNAYNDLWKYTVSTGHWTWVSGDNTQNNAGIYGTKGTAAAANKPGARFGQSAWVDAAGDFWIFGGQGYDVNGRYGYLNDLWKYHPATGQWTWVSGDNTRRNTGVYGTKGTAAAANKPGARYYQAGWIDATGNSWLFGGYGYDGAGNQGGLNDLWKYNPTTNQWTWVSGDNTRNKTGVYGTKGTAAAANKPGNRDSHSGWVDASGNFWIFGGYDDNSGSLDNDLWTYNTATGQWTWVSGDNTQNNPGVYGTKGTAAAANKPGARYGQSATVDGGGDFWVFGGQGYDASGNPGVLNDLWKYNPTTNQWTWTSGDNTQGSTGVYGILGTASAANKPGGREYLSAWIDASNDLWVLGGYDNNISDFNDLWKFNSLLPLPIREVSLEGINRSNENLISWQTIGEENTARFEVERSTDGTDFSALGSVSAIGFGNNSYSFTDAQLPESKVYYRLRIEDSNGAFSYSRVIVLPGGTQNSKFTVYPNPAKNSITLNIADFSLLNTTVKLFDAGGRLVGAFRISGGQQYIDLSRIPRGIFLLQLTNGETVKIVKE
ncbi:MAG TPA: kelch repeat-containing protein [Puia sp.]|nr:kelch repeat-containing protein [Puia sp.]